MIPFLPIGEFCETGSGGTPSRSKQKEFYDSGTIPWIKSGELSQNIIASAEEFITTKAIAESSAKLLKPGAILVAMYGATVGQVSRLKISAATNQAICHIYPDTNICEPDYLYRVLKGAKERLLAKRVGGGQPNISQRIVRDLQIPLPPLPEQKRIAGILDAADVLLAKRRESIAELDRLLQSTFLDMFGDPAINSKSLNTISLGELGNWKSGGTPSRKNSTYFKGTIPWFSSGELEDMYISKSAEGITETALEETAAKRVEMGSLMLGMYDTAALKASIANVKCSCNQAIAFTKLDATLCTNVYAYFAIRIGRKQFRRLQRGVRQKNLNLSMVKSIQIPLPPLNDQQRFTNFVKSARCQNSDLLDHLTELNTLFASLQSRAFSGEL